MISERHGGAILVWAPAKVNLFLEVLSKRADGYHDIATFMVAVTLWDTLEFKEDATGTVELACDHPELSTGPENLICRAAELLRQHTGTTQGAQVRLRKRIPMAAGLAGGSSDAAATLDGLNQLWRLGFLPSELAALGAKLGSDVPFFFAGPAAWCTGRGEIVEPMPLSGILWLVIVSPAVGLRTADVYGNVTVPTTVQTGEAFRHAVQAGKAEEISAALHNRLEEPAVRLCPAIADVQARLQSRRPLGVRMSGSGASVFALCRDREEAVRIAREFRLAADEASRPAVHIVRSAF